MTLEIFQKELELLISARAETVEDIARTLPKKAAPINMVKDYKIELIRKAIRDQKRLNIAYLSSWKNEMTRRTITPMEIQEGYESPYVVAYCHLRKETRNFRLDGIIKAELTGEKDD